MRGGSQSQFRLPQESVVLKLNAEINLVPARSFELNQEII
jgi:hypothetical protein